MSTINVLFVGDNEIFINLQLTTDTKFSEAVKKYQIKAGMNLTEKKLFFNSKEISKDCDETLAELGIENMSKIEVKSLNVSNCSDVIHVFFRCQGEQKIFQLRKNMKFSEVTSIIADDMDYDEYNGKLKYIFNSQNIDFKKTLDEIGIKNNSRIDVIIPFNLSGARLSIKSILDNEANKGIFSKKKSGKRINVYFQLMNEERIFVRLKDNIMFADVTSQYCEQYGYLTGKKIEYDKAKFIYNGKEIKSYSHKTLAELGIVNDTHIFVLISETIDKDSFDKNNIEKEQKINNNLSKEAEENSLKKEEESNIIKKYDLNIIYYDENIKNKENNDNCTFFDMNINGTFYGCHYFDLFKIVCEKIKNKKKRIYINLFRFMFQKSF